ncbi:MAG: hypothetical protein Q9176_003761 [Flavoplaca citrina]
MAMICSFPTGKQVHFASFAIPPLSCSQNESAVSARRRKCLSRNAQKMTHPSSTANGTPIEAPIVAFARSDVEPGASEIGTHPSGVETGTLAGSVPIDVAEA